MIKLYQYDMCPYCEKVRKKLDELGIKYEKVEVDYANKPEPVTSTGGTVPVIDDNGMIMNESMEIIAYLEKKYGSK